MFKRNKPSTFPSSYCYSCCYLEKKSHLLVLGLSLEFDKWPIFNILFQFLVKSKKSWSKKIKVPKNMGQ